MTKDKKLSRSEQLSLGRTLRDFYRNYVEALPLHLVGLAHRVPDEKVTGTHLGIPAPFDELRTAHQDVFDPETLRILVEAFDKAWRDLQSLKRNPATETSLALTLMTLVKEGERRPSQLATKAVLSLIGPQSNR